MLASLLAAIVAALFLAGVLRDRRAFSNAVLLGLALALAALGLITRLIGLHTLPARLLLLAVALLVALGPILVAAYLIHNGITMARRESFHPRNMLSLCAGLLILGVIFVAVVAQHAGSVKLTVMSAVLVLLSGYVSFLFASYVLYAYLYGRLPPRRDAGFVIVLGSGLGPGGSVPPLLASRLDRARAVYATIAANGGRPVLIVSGGKGTDEQVSEAAAMARYLIDRGFPEDRIMCEDRSRSTEENLVNSKALMLPGSSCVIVTSSFHAFRAAMLARRLGIDGQATGAPVAGYYWPSAVIREFGAVFLSYKLVNLGVCLLIVAMPLGLAMLHLTAPPVPHGP